MLETLAISGYRSLRAMTLPLAPLSVITGANGSGKSSLYRALRLLADTAKGGAVATLAREGGLDSVLWAGPEEISRRMRSGEVPVQGTARRKQQVRLRLGFVAHDLGYVIELGLPIPSNSAFGRDPEIKRECLFAAPILRAASTLVDRSGSLVRTRTSAGKWEELTRDLPLTESMLGELGDPRQAPEVYVARERVRNWRFYDQFRTDAEAPARQRHIGTRTIVMAHDGHDLASALQTILEIGPHEDLAETIADAFAGSRVEIDLSGDRFGVQLRQPGLLRPLDASELSDGTLRYLLWTAALLTPRPPELMVLNEPETSLHPELLPALARLIRLASRRSQLIVVTHAGTLVDALAQDDGCLRIELRKELGETQASITGRDEPVVWAWPSG